MTGRERLDSYLHELRSRVRTLIVARAAAVAAVGVLLITCLVVWILQRNGYPFAVAVAGRVFLVVLLLAAGAFAVLALRRWNRDEGAHEFERLLPTQQGRLQTYLDARRRESQGARSPLLDLLAEDAANVAAAAPPETTVSKLQLNVPMALAAVGVVVLAALIVAGPAQWGYGTRHLLFGVTLPRDAVPVRSVTVTPGDATVRRNSDLAIHATVEGFEPDQASVYVRFAEDTQWQRAPMQAIDGGKSWGFKLFAVRAPVQYYVVADDVRSTEHRVGVVDLPRIERVRLTYQYPEWTGLSPAVEEATRDIRAVAGTTVKLEVFANAPLEAPALLVDGAADAMSQANGTSTGNIAVAKPGHYLIGARVANEFVPLTDEYTIEIVQDEKPVIEILKPGRDWRATNIEEVPVRIRAEDDFRLQNVELHYAVNGGDWQTVSLGANIKQASPESLLRLEELGGGPGKTTSSNAAHLLEPGDLVSYYAVAKDRHQSAQTDLFMVQVQPFERRFTQGQGGGGGGGGMGEEQGAISERQREILLATWNLQRSDQKETRSRQQLQENARMLSELQATLAAQARTLAERTRARASVDQDERVKMFVESLERAASVMDPASKHLNEFKLAQAVPVEQQALQQLLRAESAFREVQISMQQNNAGGAGSQAAHNFGEMFELEMDLEKSQYETESQLSMEQSQQEVNEAIRKLKELAARQEKLAQEAQRNQRMEEQRWRQEQLRREAEDLKRRLAELTRQQQGQQQTAQNGAKSQSQQGSSSSSQGAQSGSQSRERASQALSSLERALEDMRAANKEQQPNAQPGSESANDQQARSERAGRNLRQALRQMDQPQQGGQDLASDLDRYAKQTERMTQEQRRVESKLYEALNDAEQSGERRGRIDRGRAEQLIESKQKLASDLTQLQREMRESVHEHRIDTPKTAQRLGQIVNDVDGSNVMYRLNRSAAEIYTGRVREAAPREGLITETLETLAQELREAASQAGQEAKNSGEQQSPDALLADVAELRRAVQQAQRARQAQGEGQGKEGNGKEGQAKQGQAADSKSGDGKPPAEGSDAAGDSQSAGAQSDTRSASAQSAGGGGLSAWNPAAANGALRAREYGYSLARETGEIDRRVRDFSQRMNNVQLSAAEINSLRRMANELRRLAGDPMASYTEEMIKVIDQIELAALSVADKAKPSAPARASVTMPESVEYREAVAEYYRRLGGS